MIDLSRYTRTITNYAVLYGMKIVIALLILFVGLWLIRRLTHLLHRLMEKRGVDPSLVPFLSNIVNILLKIMLIIIVISQIGIEATSFLAILGSAGIAIGLALQGSLSNFAGGVLLLTLRPFRVGDYIDAQGQSGRVHLINIFNTVIKTGDNKTIFIPNGPLASGTIVNYDLEEKRRVDLKFAVPGGHDINKTRDIIYNLVAQDLRVFKDPAPKVVVSETTGTDVTLLVRVWASHEDYWDVYYALQENIKDTFHKEGIV
ncbi:mechanosensitive ion channel [Adhaeribacter sp. BT258]|uniref:Mechanosensitive ion channel n=1 Tax=Adhaeribacter terrigena TaxID=2793070 RepID=A0ABS1C5C8_9BACT|nr:mechanosensitive ion channel domain-containing protein [Adhaeribacter terrigena]MBK0404581.1 mechanosensitive ion channel [Adhaeribacter terrigena]